MVETKPKKSSTPRAPRRTVTPRAKPAAHAPAPAVVSVKTAAPKDAPHPALRNYFTGVGRRKTAVVMVKLFPASSKPEVAINGKALLQYFPYLQHSQVAMAALEAVGALSQFSVIAYAKGGGSHAQAVAFRMGTARALIVQDPGLRPQLRALGYLTRDSRAKERKKPGLKRARRAPQFSKR
jgi:small subunit ribosomal protein S9